MITEEQRRALFALREALHLCDKALISVEAGGDFNYCCKIRFWDETGNPEPIEHASATETLEATDLDLFLARHPE